MNLYRKILVLLHAFAFSYTLQGQGFNNTIDLKSNEPDSFRTITADLGASWEFTMGELVVGIQASAYLFQNSRSALQFNLMKYWVASPKNLDVYEFPRSTASKQSYFQVDGVYSFLPWKKTKIKTSSVTVDSYSAGGTAQNQFNKPLDNKQNKRYGFRIGVSLSKLPVTSLSKKGVGLYQFRNSTGDAVSYKNEFSTSGSTSLLCLGMQSRKQIRYRYDVIEKNTAFPHNTAYVRDLYFDLTYLARLRYEDIYDQTDKLEQDGIRDIYSIPVEDNPIQPLGFRIGIQALHQGGKKVGIKVGAEFGSRYGIGASSFAFTNLSTYYTKFSMCMILLPDPR